MPRYDQGAALTFDINRDRIDIDVSKDIVQHVPAATPFMIIGMRAARQNVATSEFLWWDDPPPAWWTTVDHPSGSGNSYADDGTEIRVVDPSIFVAGDSVKVANSDLSLGEILLVTAVNYSTRVLTVERSYSSAPLGGIAAAVIPHGTNLLKLAPGMVENSLSPNTTKSQPEQFVNYVQTLRTPFDGSWEAEHDRTKTSGNERTRERQNKALLHKLEIERAALWGQRQNDASENRRMTGGVLQFIANDNVYDISSSANGILTEPEFESFLEMGFTYGSAAGKDRKLLLCSPRVGSVINQFAAGRIRTTSGEESYGIRLKEYLSFHGTVYIAVTRTFERDYANMALLLDMDNIKFRTRQATTLRTNIQENDRDGWKDEYMTKFGMQVRAARTHAVLTGVTQ